MIRSGQIYHELETRKAYRRWWPRRYTRAARQVHGFFIDVTELTDRAENALKLVGDVFAARLLALTHSRLGFSAWRDSVQEKLKTLDEIYHFAVDQAGMARGHLLELAIIAILVFERAVLPWHHELARDTPKCVCRLRPVAPAHYSRCMSTHRSLHRIPCLIVAVLLVCAAPAFADSRVYRHVRTPDSIAGRILTFGYTSSATFRALGERDLFHRRQLAERQLETKRKQQQRHTELRHLFDVVQVGDKVHAGNA